MMSASTKAYNFEIVKMGSNAMTRDLSRSENQMHSRMGFKEVI